MVKSVTPEQLVLFVYNEISDIREKAEICEAIRSDSDLYDKYLELLDTCHFIENSKEHSVTEPPDRVINNLMNYSRALTILETQHKTKIELLMN